MATANELKTVDGFDTFESGTEGEDERSTAGRTIYGTRIKFTNQATWLCADTEEILPPELELVMVDIARVVIKWDVDGQPIQSETIVLQPGQRFPNVEKMNEDAPQEEWREDPSGRPVGPFQRQHVVYLVDMRDMSRFSWPTATIGGAVAIEDIVDRTKWKRRQMGPNTYPLVRLSHCFMNTRHGGRERPNFRVVNWVRLGGEGGTLPPAATPAIPGPTTTSEPATPSGATEQLNKFAAADPKDVKVVKPPTAAEEMKDKLPF
jgi:hypothetical protein